MASGSKKFLEDIKEIFKIRNKIHTREGAFDLYLGADLFNEMLHNFRKSLNRKRIRLESSRVKRKRFLIEREKFINKQLNHNRESF